MRNWLKFDFVQFEAEWSIWSTYIPLKMCRYAHYIIKRLSSPVFSGYHIQWIAHPWSIARSPSSSTERRLLFILLIFHFNIWLNVRKWNVKFLTLVGCFVVRRKKNGRMEDSCVNMLDPLDVWFATSENAIEMRHFWNHTCGTDIGNEMPYSLPHCVEEHQTQYTHPILKSNMPYYHSTICKDSTALACFGCSITIMRKMSNHFVALN